jgi:uncharacterized protein
MPLSCTVEVRLKPNSRQESVTAGDNGVVVARVNAPPIEGRANAALIEIIAETLSIPKSRVSIKRGHTSKNKVVEIVGLTKEQVAKRISGK